MGYVIAAILVLLIVAAGVTFFVLRAARGRNEAAIVEPDQNTPLGDTDEHAGRQTPEGTTVDGHDESGAHAHDRLASTRRLRRRRRRGRGRPPRDPRVRAHERPPALTAPTRQVAWSSPGGLRWATSGN